MTEQQLSSIHNKESNSFNGKKLIGRAIDYWYWYLLSLLICMSYAWFTVHYATPMYKVYAQVLVQDDKNAGSPLSGSGGSSGFDFSSLFSGKTNMFNEIAILQTTDLVQKAVNELHLNTTYYHKGSIREVELYKSCPFSVNYPQNIDNNVSPITMELKFAQKYANDFTLTVGKKTVHGRFYDTIRLRGKAYYFTKNGKGFDINASYLVKIITPQSAADNVSVNLLTELLAPKGTVLRMTYNTNFPKKGEDVLGAIIRAYINRNLNEKNKISDNTIDFINTRIGLVGDELGGIETTIQQFKQNNKIADLTAQSQLLITNSGDYYQKLNDLEVQLQVINAMLSYVENNKNNRRPVPALLNTDPTFSGIVGAYNTAQVQRDKLLLSVKENNPLTNNLDAQINGLRGDMARSLKSQLEALQISKQQLATQNSRIATQIHNVPRQEREFLDFSREQDVKQALYLFLLQKKEETAITKASNVPNAGTIQAPRANYVPYTPNMGTTLTIGFLLGLIIPTGFIMLKFVLNNKVLSREDITETTPATIISEIGHNSHQGLLDLTEEGRSIIAEQFRIFRTNMDFTVAKKKCPVILITSGMSGDGKSFIVANLGQIYAISGKRVLLLELDLRKPKLSSIFGLSNELGFSNFAVSTRPAAEFVLPVTVNSNLFIMPSGPIPPNPAELLLSDKTTSLIEELSKQFDIILIDTAPIGAVTDAQILGKLADVSLYVVRQQYTIKNSLEIVNDILLNEKLPSLYLIVNDVQTGTSYKYGYGYGYKYGYGYGYTDKVKKSNKSWWSRQI